MIIEEGEIRDVIRGFGVDLMSIKRMEEAVNRFGQRLLIRVFTPEEIDYCMGKRFPASHLAGRWAIKEAFFKAMGIGWGQGLRWLDVEWKGVPGGPPRVVLKGETRQRAEELGIREIWASLSHERDFAVAAVMLSGEKQADHPQGQG